MRTQNLLRAATLSIALIAAGVLVAQKPVENIDPHRHSNLADAQRFVIQAYDKCDAAQQANKDQLGGHAENAKKHLVAADQELKLAADYADHHK